MLAMSCEFITHNVSGFLTYDYFYMTAVGRAGAALRFVRAKEDFVAILALFSCLNVKVNPTKYISFFFM